MSNDLAGYIEKGEKLEHQRLAMENELESDLKLSFEDMVLGGRIFMAIHNLHHKAVSFNGSLKKSHNPNSKPVNSNNAKLASPQGSNSPKKIFFSKQDKINSEFLNLTKDEIEDREYFDSKIHFLHRTVGDDSVLGTPVDFNFLVKKLYEKLSFVYNNLEDYKTVLGENNRLGDTKNRNRK